MIPPLAIIQARLMSQRFPFKMLCDLGGHPVLWWAHQAAWETFENVVIACPQDDHAAIRRAVPYAEVFGWTGDVNDVLGRFHACAHHYADNPQTVIVRITPDDFPIDVFRERCTLAELDHWHATVTDPVTREHIGTLFSPRIEINELADLEKARAHVQSQQRLDRSPV